MLLANQPKRVAAGLYKGSGVAPGGQVGRLRAITHGVGGAKAGRVPAGSALGARKIGTTATHVPTPSGIGTTATHVPVAQQYVSPVASHVPPAAPQGIADPTDPSGLLHDSGYYNELAGYQRGYSDQVAPMNAERSGLLAKDPITGKTIYDFQLGRAQNMFNRGVRDTRSQMSDQGLLHSGANDIALNDAANGFTQQQSDLYNQYGQGRLNTIDTQLKQAQAAFDEQKRLAALEAAARAQQNLYDQNMATYSMTYPQGG